MRGMLQLKNSFWIPIMMFTLNAIMDFPSEIELTAYWNHHREGLDGLQIYADHGVTRVLVNTAALRMGRPDEAVTQFAEEALPAAAALG